MDTKGNVIIGFNKTAKGKAIHAINEGGIALCDKRIHLVINTDKPLTVKDVTCPKCLVYKEIKIDLEKLGISKRPIPKSTSVPKPKAKPKSKPKAKPKSKPKEKPKEEEKKPKAKVSPKPKAKPKSKPKAKPKEEREKAEWGWKRDKNRKTTCSIVHIPTGQVFFEKIKIRFAKPAVKELNQMKVHWKKPEDRIPKKFVKTAKAIVLNIINGKGEVKGKENKGRKLKRRGEKKGRKKIKRRNKSEDLHPITEMFGRREGSPGFDVASLLAQGASFHKMTNKLVKGHKLLEKKARSKVKGIIRKTVKQGHIIRVTLYKDEERNFYQLIDR